MSNNESKAKLFIENMLFYGGISMLTKALPFITLPIITRLLSDSSTYGISDIFNVINSFGSAIAIMGLYDAIFREYFEKTDDVEYQKKVTATGLNLVLISSITLGMFICFFRKKIGIILFESTEYSSLITISAITIFFMAITSILESPTRMRNKRKIYLFTGIGFPTVGFLMTIFFIRIGYTYEALIYSTLGISIFSAIIFLSLNRKDFSFKILDKKVSKELCKIGLPLLPTFLIYWIFNSMDRIMINRILGAGELGIYSIGSKVASISQLIYAAFSSGFAYFKYSTMKDEDQVKFNSQIFEYLGIISILSFVCAQPFIKPVFNFFFKGNYVRGSEIFGFLFLSPLMLMLFQIVGSQLIIIKKSWISTLSLFLGAIINLYLNYYLIQSHGIRGASISTLSGYIISVIIVCIVCLNKKLFILKKRFLIIFIALIIGIFLEFFGLKESNYIYGLVFFLSGFLYFGDLKKLKKRS